MNDKKIYIVAKVFDKPGSLAYLCKTPNEGAGFGSMPYQSIM